MCLNKADEKSSPSAGVVARDAGRSLDRRRERRCEVCRFVGVEDETTAWMRRGVCVVVIWVGRGERFWVFFKSK